MKQVIKANTQNLSLQAAAQLRNPVRTTYLTWHPPSLRYLLYMTSVGFGIISPTLVMATQPISWDISTHLRSTPTSFPCLSGRNIGSLLTVSSSGKLDRRQVATLHYYANMDLENPNRECLHLGSPSPIHFQALMGSVAIRIRTYLYDLCEKKLRAHSK